MFALWPNIRHSRTLLITIACAIAAALLTACAPPSSQVATHQVEDLAITSIDSFLAERAESKIFSGTVLIAEGDEILLSKGYGLADVDSGTRNTPQTRFAISSNTKAFTAAAILLLEERGQLSTNDSVCAYLPDCPESWAPITILNLLTHTHGLSEDAYMAAFDPSQDRQLDPLELVKLIQQGEPVSPPGSQFNYGTAGIGYILLGAIIEETSGQTYEEFLRHNILAPLEMTDTGFIRGDCRLATGYSVYDVQASPPIGSYVYSAGALYSTVEDLFAWVRGLAGGRVISTAGVDAMFSPQVDVPAPQYPGLATGYGWYVYSTNGHKYVGHAGGPNGGFVSDIRYFPEDEVTIIILNNMNAYGYAADLMDNACEKIFPES